MKATELLSQQHREVEAIFAAIQEAEGSDDKEALVEELATQLAAHMTIEQEIFYPICVSALDDEDLIIESYDAVARCESQVVTSACNGREALGHLQSASTCPARSCSIYSSDPPATRHRRGDRAPWRSVGAR